jgi:hypothetical protein
MNAAKKPGIKTFTDGTYEVDVEMTVTFDGANVSITDHADKPIGDACLALHSAAAAALKGASLKERHYTDGYERKPKPERKQANEQRRANVVGEER